MNSERNVTESDDLEDVTEPLPVAPEGDDPDIEELAGEDADDSFLDEEDGE